MEKISKIIPPNRRTQPEVFLAPAQKPGVFKSRRAEEQKLDKTSDSGNEQALREATLADSLAMGEMKGSSLDTIDRLIELKSRAADSAQDRLTISEASRSRALDSAQFGEKSNLETEKLGVGMGKDSQGYEKMKESQRAQMVENLSKRFFAPQAQVTKKSEIDDEAIPKSKRLSDQIARNEQLANG
jgi:hypothetical protein